MRQNRFLAIPALALLGAIFDGCADENPVAPGTSGVDVASDERVIEALAEASRLEEIAAEADGGVATWIAEITTEDALRGASVVVVPAGSVDALAAALASAGAGGTVILESGLHTESATVTITNFVRLVGEHGAILQVDTTPYFEGLQADPALHVRNASRVLIWGIDVQPTGAVGNTGILLENAPRTTVSGNSVTGFQTCIMLHQADRSLIHGNTVSVASFNGFFGIEVVNGNRVSIVGNEVSDAPNFGIWACDRDGTILFNNLHDNVIGLIFCKVPAGSETLPSGEAVGADETATNWVAAWNVATNNQWGYLAIDGATGCTLFHNDASGNGFYDVELAGDSLRFGFFTPTSSNCTAIIHDPAIVVKDCGLNNTVVGGTQVDTNVDPCF